MSGDSGSSRVPTAPEDPHRLCHKMLFHLEACHQTDEEPDGDSEQTKGSICDNNFRQP